MLGPPRAMDDPRNKSVMRSLGEFFGHIVRAVVTDPAAGASRRREVRRDITEETRDTPTGKVTLRRTTIEEVEFHPDENRTDADAPASDGQE